MAIRFIFLGTGTSSGIPAIGCACAVCSSPDPNDTRLRAAAAICFEDAEGFPRTVLIDAGPDLRQQSLRAQLKRLDAILFTHNHVDHTFGLDEVRRFNAVQKAPIAIYADDHTMGFLRRVYRHIFERDQNINDSFVATLIPHTIAERVMEEGRSIDVFGLRVTPFRMLHGGLPILSYRFDLNEGLKSGGPSPFPLAYCTDVSGVPPGSWKHLEGLNTLVIDALRHRKHPTHFTLGQAIGVAERVTPAMTYFTHIAHEMGHAETQETLPERMSLAWDGLVLSGGLHLTRS